MDGFMDGVQQFYTEIGKLVGGIVFFTSWVYCAFTYGFLLGFGLGWIPSMILCIFAIALWPLFIFLLVLFWTPVFLTCVGIAQVLMQWSH